MSRFRVENQREEDVRSAFLHRPGLVDNQPGFLGLEVFQDETDSALFYLVTRWTDTTSFRTWHSSKDHKRSHEMMPKGLKLDSAFTELRILKRIEAESDVPALTHFTGDWGALTKAYLASSDTAHCIIADLDGVILGTTAAVQRLLGFDVGSLQGQRLWNFLSPESTAALLQRIQAKSRCPDRNVILTFAGTGLAARQLRCSVDVQPQAFALLGEPVFSFYE